MNGKVMIVACSLLAVTCFATEEERYPTEVLAEMSVFSAYVSRGQVSNDEPVGQPFLRVSKYGFAAEVWANYDFTDRNRTERQFNEIDLVFGYGYAWDKVSADVGLIEYVYPNTKDPTTREVFLAAEAPLLEAPIGLMPGLCLFYDFEQAKGVYATAGLSVVIEPIERLAAEACFSAGYGSAGYNEYFFEVDKAAPNDGNVGLTLTYAANDALEIAATLSYMWLWDSEIRAGARRIYWGEDRLWGGGTVTYCF